MANTIRHAEPGAHHGKRNIASLVGGYIIALGCLVLYLLVASELTSLTWPVVIVGILFAACIGLWIRIDDL